MHVTSLNYSHYDQPNEIGRRPFSNKINGGNTRAERGASKARSFSGSSKQKRTCSAAAVEAKQRRGWADSKCVRRLDASHLARVGGTSGEAVVLKAWQRPTGAARSGFNFARRASPATTGHGREHQPYESGVKCLLVLSSRRDVPPSSFASWRFPPRVALV